MNLLLFLNRFYNLFLVIIMHYEISCFFNIHRAFELFLVVPSAIINRAFSHYDIVIRII